MDINEVLEMGKELTTVNEEFDPGIEAMINRMTDYLADELYSYYDYEERHDFCQKYAKIIMNKPMNLKQAIIDFNNGNYD